MRPLKILVVDDEKLAREEICFLLGQIGGCELVGEASDGVSALRAAGELKPDLMFLDIQMPGLTGFEVARRLASEETAKLPLTPAELEKVIEAVQARQGRRDQLAIRVAERFVLVQADEVVFASLVDEAIV